MIRDIYLSSDERYDIWLVKCAERPELIEIYEEKILEPTDAHENNLALTDGCDLPNWRSLSLPVCSVGFGCTLLRRESQLPVPTKLGWWEILRNELFGKEPTRAVPRLQYCNNDGTILPNAWFERDNVPVLLDGCASTWPAMTSCRFENLLANFGYFYWRCSDTHGETVTLSTYAKYLQTEALLDDAPFGLYDSEFGSDERACLLDDYQVPTCFPTDLFELYLTRRPPSRWILIGPARSGTGLHVDPVGTHAWVTLIQGCKRWVLFPAGTNVESIHMQSPQIPSSLWFKTYYAQVLEQYPDAVEILQRPGETVYVPAGWPHLVLNLELSVAITHNYATEYPSMQRLYKALVEQEPEMAGELYASLQEKRPELAREIDLYQKSVI
jgi:hypothetical protein